MLDYVLLVNLRLQMQYTCIFLLHMVNIHLKKNRLYFLQKDASDIVGKNVS